MANVVSATPRVGRSQRPRLHHASSCAGTRRARLGLRGRSEAPTTAPPTVAALTPAQMKIPIYEEARPQGTRGLRPDDSCRNACSPQASHGAPGGRPSASLSTHEQASPLPLSRLPDRTTRTSAGGLRVHARFRPGKRASARPCRVLARIVRCGSRKAGGADACSGAEASVRVTRLMPLTGTRQRASLTAHPSPRTAVCLCSAATAWRTRFRLRGAVRMSGSDRILVEAGSACRVPGRSSVRTV